MKIDLKMKCEARNIWIDTRRLDKYEKRDNVRRSLFSESTVELCKHNQGLDHSKGNMKQY